MRGEVTLSKPFPFQREWLDSQARFKTICAGRRSGKTDTMITMVVDGHGGGKYPGVLHGAKLAWLAPSNKQARKLWRRVKSALGECWSHKNETDKRLEFHGGGSLELLSAEAPEAALGDGYDGMAVEEAARIDGYVWKETFRPMLSDKAGWAVFISTPRGLGNWFHEYYLRPTEREGWESWQVPSEMNPVIPKSEFEEALFELGALIYEQEYGAQFVSDAIAIFKREFLRYYKDLPVRMAKVVQSWDCTFKDEMASKSGRVDWVVGQVWGVCDANRYLMDQFRERIDFSGTVEAVKAMKARYPETQEIYIEDKANGPAVISVLRDKIERITPVNPEGGKIGRAHSQSSLWASGNVLVPEGMSFTRTFVDEVTAFPNSPHDDQVDAMTQALVKLKASAPHVKRQPEKLPMASYAHLANGGSL